MKNDIKEEVIKVMIIKGNKKITAIELGEPNPPHIYENKRILDPYLFFQSDKHQGLMIYTRSPFPLPLPPSFILHFILLI